MPPTIPVFIDGDWRTPSADTPSQPVHNPSSGEPIALVPLLGREGVDEAVQAAARAFPAWRETPAPDRAQVLFRYKALLEQHFDEISAIITREHGKTLAESEGSLRRGIEVVDFACGAPSLLMGDALESIAHGIDGEAVRQPLGVCAGITPFNFPAMVPLWMVPIALACGNTFVLKPSEQVPLTAVRLVELLAEAGLPPGVLNLVHGQAEAVDALLDHPDVRAVSFVGSSPVARHVYERAAASGKRVQAAGGAKNFIVVMPDAEIDGVVSGVLGSAFGCAGERCMSGSVMVTLGEAHQPVLEAVRAGADSLEVGPSDRAAPGMGPLVSAPHLARVEEYINVGVAEGAELIRDGREVQVPDAEEGFFLGPTIFDGVTPAMRIAQEEIFGPVLSVMNFPELDEAIAAINRSGFGNGATIFTQSGKAARWFKQRVEAGMVGINVGAPAAMAFFPFSGWNGSFYGDLHMQGNEGVAFYKRQRVTMTRW